MLFEADFGPFALHYWDQQAHCDEGSAATLEAVGSPLLMAVIKLDWAATPAMVAVLHRIHHLLDQ